MLTKIVLVAVLGLVRYDTQETQPSLSPPKEACLFVWEDYSGGYYYTAGTEREASRPQRIDFEIWRAAIGMGNPVVVVDRHDVQHVRTVPLRQLWQQATVEAKRKEEPPPCFPGEFPGHGAW